MSKKKPLTPSPRGINDPRPKLYVLEDIKQMEAMVSPMRRKLTRVLSAIGPATVKQLAEQMGRTPESLYYHVRALEKVGLLLEVGKRSSVRRNEAIYDTVADHAVSPVKPGDSESKWSQILEKVVQTDLRLMARHYSLARKKSETVTKGPARQVDVMQTEVRLSKAALRKVNAKIMETMRFIDEQNNKGRGELYHFMSLQAPVPLDDEPSD